MDDADATQRQADGRQAMDGADVIVLPGEYEETTEFDMLSWFLGEHGARKAARVKYDIGDCATGVTDGF